MKLQLRDGAALAALLLCLLAPAAAQAHALLKKTEPARRAQITKAPAAVRLWFSEALEPAFSSVTVVDASGTQVTREPARVSTQVTREPARVSTQDPTLLEVALPALSAGQYTVRYQVLSIDGHTVKATFTFRVKEPAPE
jgi:methionine-rich copper-binding protein CopC